MPKVTSSLPPSGQQLIDACISCDLIAVRKLLDKGVDVNWKNKAGDTGLIRASVEGRVEVAKLLIDRGAQIDIQNNHGHTALMSASYNGTVDCARLLLEKGAEMSIKTKKGRTAKDWAVQRGQVSMVHLLDECKAKKQLSLLAQIPQAQVLEELVLEPLNKALQEANSNLKAENRVLKEREICKQELMDEYKARAKNVEDENRRGKEENQRYRDEVSSLKEKEAAMKVEIEYLKRRDEESRLDRTAERAMFQTMMSNLMNGLGDRKRKRNNDDDDDDETNETTLPK